MKNSLSMSEKLTKFFNVYLYSFCIKAWLFPSRRKYYWAATQGYFHRFLMLLLACFDWLGVWLNIIRPCRLSCRSVCWGNVPLTRWYRSGNRIPWLGSRRFRRSWLLLLRLPWKSPLVALLWLLLLNFLIHFPLDFPIFHS